MNRLASTLTSILLVLCLVGCATNPATGKREIDWARVDRVADAAGENILNNGGKLALASLAGVTMEVAQGHTDKADLQQGATEYLWKSIGTVDVAGDVQRLLVAAKADPNVAAKAASAYVAIAPTTDTQKADAVNAIAMAINLAADNRSTDGKAVAK